MNHITYIISFFWAVILTLSVALICILFDIPIYKSEKYFRLAVILEISIFIGVFILGIMGKLPYTKRYEKKSISESNITPSPQKRKTMMNLLRYLVAFLWAVVLTWLSVFIWLAINICIYRFDEQHFELITDILPKSVFIISFILGVMGKLPYTRKRDNKTMTCAGIENTKK